MEKEDLISRLAELEQRAAGMDAEQHGLLREIQDIRTQLGASAVPGAQTVPAATSRGASKPRVALILILTSTVLISAGVAGFVLFRGLGAEKSLGHASVVASVFGTFAFDTDDCDSGASYVPPFFGADLKTETQKLRIYNSGEQAYLALWRPGTKQTLEVSRESCTRWDVLIEWAHVRMNRVDTVSGHLHVDCALPGGGNLKADAEFVRCAF